MISIEIIRNHQTITPLNKKQKTENPIKNKKTEIPENKKNRKTEQNFIIR